MFKEKTTQSQVIETLDVASSTWYKSQTQSTEDKRKNNKGRPKSQTSMTCTGEIVSDVLVIEALRNIRAQTFFQNGGGYRKLTHYLRRNFGYNINKKKVYRLCSENGLLLPRGVKKIKRRTPISVNRTISRPFQLWELDIKYGFIHGENRFFFLMAIIDVYLRYIVGFHIGLRCLGSDLVRTLKLSIERMGIEDSGSLVIRMDNGSQMTSNAMFNYATQNSEKIIHELIPVQTPNKDAHIESFYSILETECFQVNIFNSFLEGYSTTCDFIKFYHDERIHSSLGYRTPTECLDLYRKGNLSGIKNIRL
jgi:putative transposase